MNCKLIIPTSEYADEIKAYRAEMNEAKSPLDGAIALESFEDPLEWIEYNRGLMNEDALPEGFVQATQFIYVRESDNKIVGMANVRHRLNDYLNNYGGNIGYSVRPSERRKGYAKSMLKEALAFCRALGIKRALITCNTDNAASRRTILANGGVYENTLKEPDGNKYIERYWIEV